MRQRTVDGPLVRGERRLDGVAAVVGRVPGVAVLGDDLVAGLGQEGALAFLLAICFEDGEDWVVAVTADKEPEETRKDMGNTRALARNIATHLLEQGVQAVPVPLHVAPVKLGAPKIYPPVVVVFGPAVKVLPVDGRAPADGHAEDDGGGAVVDALDGRRRDDEATRAAAVLLGVVVADGALDLAVLDDEDGACAASAVSIRVAVSRGKAHLSIQDPVGDDIRLGKAAETRSATVNPAVPAPMTTKS